MLTNELYLVVLPLIHVSVNQIFGFGLTEQALTLFPDRDFATKFFPDEVENYVATFQNRANKYLTGGHVTHYEIQQERTDDGRVIVKVIQHVTE
jgi:hypothetical protein